MMDGSEGECEESCSIVPFGTSLTCCMALCTFAQYSVCPQSSSLSTDDMRKHDDSTHSSVWAQVTLKEHLLYTCAFDIFKCLSPHQAGDRAQHGRVRLHGLRVDRGGTEDKWSGFSKRHNLERAFSLKSHEPTQNDKLNVCHGSGA